MIDIIIKGLLGLAAVAATGYGVYKLVEALSPLFVEVWKRFVSIVKDIWGYVTEATEAFLASIVQFLDENWTEIVNDLRQELGYAQSLIMALFKEGREVLLGFAHPQQGQSLITSIGVLEDQNVQLPSRQNPLVVELVLS